jgi:hypothetical protein
LIVARRHRPMWLLYTVRPMWLLYTVRPMCTLYTVRRVHHVRVLSMSTDLACASHFQLSLPAFSCFLRVAACCCCCCCGCCGCCGCCCCCRHQLDSWFNSLRLFATPPPARLLRLI